jgi:hypothetical protein
MRPRVLHVSEASTFVLGRLPSDGKDQLRRRKSFTERDVVVVKYSLRSDPSLAVP